MADSESRARPTSKACNVCHAKRTKCDGNQPCSACIGRRSPNECKYDRVAKKRGVPKGTESAVHKRLRQLEELLRANMEANRAMLAGGLGAGLAEAPAAVAAAEAALAPFAITSRQPRQGIASATLGVAPIGLQIAGPAPNAFPTRSTASPPPSYPFVPDLLGTFDAPGANFTLLAEQISRSLTGAQPLQFAAPPQAIPTFSVDDALSGLFPGASPESYDDYLEMTLSATGTSEDGSSGTAESGQLSPVTVLPGFAVTFSLPRSSQNPVFAAYPAELIQSLMATFFTSCYSLAPIFQPTTFLASVDRNPPVLLLAMMALAAKSSTHPLAKPEEFFERAKEELGRELEIGSSVELAQALHVLTLYSMSSGGLGSLSYIYAALGTRMCFELGLNREPPSDLGFVAAETRRRVFWVIYGTDRLQTVAGNRPLAVKDSECQLRLPVGEIVWQGLLGEEAGLVKLRMAAYQAIKALGSRTLNGVAGPEGAFVLFPESDMQEFAEQVLSWIDAPEEDIVKLNPIRRGRERMDPFTYYILLTNLYGKVHGFHSQCAESGINPFSPEAPQEIVTRLRTLDAALMDWLAALPDFCRTIAPNAVFRSRLLVLPNDPDGLPVESDEVHSYHTAYMHLFYHGIRIVLHRPRRLEEMARDSVWLVSESFVRCAESAETVAGIVASLLAQPDRKLASLPPSTMFLAFQAALIELLIVRNLKPKATDSGIAKLAEEAQAKVELHRRFLDEMARAWKGEPLLADLLKRLLADVSLPLATDGPEILQLRGR
ncbi:fungal-specific transcription factor domain-containing protein [Hyaloraphidium curvatum]|nr:fungal-specific transcription factor domain-containing protein [Hyaloraphidium curvatum]